MSAVRSILVSKCSQNVRLTSHLRLCSVKESRRPSKRPLYSFLAWHQLLQCIWISVFFNFIIHFNTVANIILCNKTTFKKRIYSYKAGYRLRAAAARGNVCCFASQSQYHVVARGRTNTARAKLARDEPNRSGSLSRGKGISVCCALSVETVMCLKNSVDQWS
jgi:hypothetical protein